MNNDEDVPALDDFEQEIKEVKYNKPKDYGSQDYAKPDSKYMDDDDKEKQIQSLNKKVQNIQLTIDKKKETIAKQKGQGYGGFKKGFLSGGGSTQKPKQTKITQVKAPKNVNPLEIKQVQEAMKMNNYLQQTKSQWMTNNFLQQVTTNQKIGKLFSNPEYMKAIDMFKNNPKQAMAKYGNNKQFMEAFQQFCKMMGMQFQNLAQTEKK